jgi:endonuclease I/DNA-directed RNA polymerase subunit RPC12/RpoP
MKSFGRRIFALILTLSMLLSLLAGLTLTVGAVDISSNSKTRDTVCTALSADAQAYYTGQYTYATLSSLSGVDSTDSYTATQNNPLYTRLYTLMSSTRNSTTVTYSGTGSTSLAHYWAYTDAEAGSSSYLYFYTDILQSSSDGFTMNREHVWPQSKASYYQLNGGADLHHLRPSISGVNQSKSNRAFGDKDSSFSAYQVNNNDVIWTGTRDGVDLLDVKDNVKGDVARILLYVYVRWQQPNLYSDVASANLPTLDSDDSADNGIRIIENRATLLQWCKEDPVDAWEMERNDLVQDVQGNRNVFIDYPELAWLIFGQTVPSDMQTPSGEAAGGGSSVAITAVSNNTSYGTVSLSGSTITATPATGYYTAGYTVTSGTAAVTQSGNTFTVTASADCTVQINFAQKQTYTITFSVPDGVTQAAVSGYAGDAITLPTPTGTPSADKYAYTFAGWTDAVVDNSGVAPTLYTGSYTPSANTTLYALYTYTGTASSNDYVKVSGNHADWSGSYLIVYEPGSRIFDGSLTSFDSASNFKGVTITDHTISAADGDAYKFTIAKSGSYYTICSASGYYIGKTANSAGINASTSTTYTNSFSVDGSGDTDILSSGGAYLRFNKDSSELRFRYYASSNYANQEPVALYVKNTAGNTMRYTTLLESAAVCAHTNTTTTTTPATCTTAGSIVVTCNDCGAIVSTTTIPATGHTWNSGVVTTPATETADGVMTYTCTVCGTTKTEAIPATGVNYTVSFRVPSGVTAINDMICNANSSILLPTPSGTPSDASHTYTFLGWIASSVDNQTSVGTYYAAGASYTASSAVTLYALYSYSGSGSGSSAYTLVTDAASLTTGSNVVIAASGYDYAIGTTQNSNNRAQVAVTKDTTANTLSFTGSVAEFTLGAGSTTGTYSFYDSTNSGYLYAASSSGNYLRTEATLSDNSSWTITIASGAATIVANGSNTHKYMQYNATSSLFSAYASGNTQKALALYQKGAGSTTYYTTEFSTTCNHANLTAVAAVAATCTAAGNSAYWHCPDCGKYFSDAAATTEITLASTVIAALGHNYTSAITTAPTCTTAGVMTYTCSRCGDTYTEAIAALGHTLTATAAKAATCTEAGNSAYWHCSVCGKYFSDAAATTEITLASTVLPALGHSYTSAVTTAATCTTAGVMTYTCSRCGDTYTEAIPALGHTLTATAAKAATCTEAGNSAYWYCSVCGKYFSDAAATTEITLSSTVLPATGHSYTYVDNGDGTHTGTCSVCGATVTENHTYVDGVCSACGAAEKLTDSSLVFYGKTVVFESDFSIKYYILKTLTDNYDEVYLNVTKTKYDNNGTVTGTETTKVSMGDYNSSYKAYSFKYAGIYSIEIGSNVSATIYGVKDGKTYEGATVGDYSIKQFCYNQLAKSTATAAYKTLLVDFLNYGASAQTYFGYNTSNLVNAELTTEQAACASTLQTINNDRADTTITNPTVTVSGCTLVFDSQIMLKFVFDPTTYLASGSLSDLTVVVKDSTGATLRTFTSSEIATYSTSATLKEVSYTALNSTEMRKAVTFQVYANGVAVSNARTYSIQSYAYSKQSGTDTNLAALTANMIKYGDSMIAWKAQ